MKKILSIVLAVAMLSTTAFANTMESSGATNINPSDTMQVKVGDFSVKSYSGDNVPELVEADISSTNFTLTKKISKGSNLVKSVAINDDKGRIDIKFNEDYGLTYATGTTAPNVVFEYLQLKAKKEIKKWSGSSFVPNVSRGDIFEMRNLGGFRVGYEETAVDVNGNYVDNGINKFTGDAYGEASGGTDILEIFGRVYKDSKIFTKFSTSVDDDQKAALKLYPEADLRFVSLTTNGLDSNNTVLLAAEEDEFVYEIKDGKVVASSLKWSDEDGAWKGKTRSSVSYVVSDVKLDVSAAVAADPANPETGANDVVGVAAALAVVSLVAAGAVSLKK